MECLLYGHEIKILKVWDDYINTPCTVGATFSALPMAYRETLLGSRLC